MDNNGRVVNTLVLAEGISRVGDAVSMVAFPLVAVLALGAGAAELALIGAAQALPILLLSLPAGAWVDSRPRRWSLLVSADIARAVLLAIVPLAAAMGVLSLPLLFVVALLSAAWGTIFDVAFAGWVPRLVTGDRLHLANARVEQARSVAVVAGPGIGGALVSALSAPVALLADAASFVVSAALIWVMRKREPAWPPPVLTVGLRRQIALGLRFVHGQALVRATIATAGINNLTRAIAMAVAILYLVDVGRLSAAQIGLAFAIGNSGFIVGAIVARKLTGRLGMGPVMQLGVGLFGPSMLLFAVAPAEWLAPTFTAMLFAHGLGISIHTVNYVTVRQVLTPDAMRARVAALTRLVIFGAVPVGTLLGGVIGEVFGLRAALLAGALGLFLGSIPYLGVRVIRLRRMEELQPADA